MTDLKELIIKKRELQKTFEILRKENIDCVKKSFLKNEELNNIRKKYFEIISRRNKLKEKKENILLSAILSLLLIIVTLILSIVFSGFLVNVIDMVLFKLIMNVVVLLETIFSISIICSKVLKYNAINDFINTSLTNIKEKLNLLQQELKNLDNVHLKYCTTLREIEETTETINKEIFEKLYKEKSIIKKSHNLIEKHSNIERVRKL